MSSGDSQVPCEPLQLSREARYSVEHAQDVLAGCSEEDIGEMQRVVLGQLGAIAGAPVPCTCELQHVVLEQRDGRRSNASCSWCAQLWLGRDMELMISCSLSTRAAGSCAVGSAG